MRFRLWITLCGCLTLCMAADGLAQFSIQGPGVDPNDFRITTFASGLNFPVGMAELSDGSILTAVSNGSSFFGSTSGSIIRLADTDGDGIADQQTTLVNNVAGGGLSALRVIDDLVFTTGQGSGKPISIYRMGANPADPLSLVGTMNVNYPGGGWLHPHSALAVRATPGQMDSYELYFQLGSKVNFADTTQNASLSSNIGVSGTLRGDAIHRVTITDNGNSISGGGLTQIATGLRNAAGMAFHPVTGDLYLEDNGIDGLGDPNEPLSADELNVIPAADIGGTIENFGFSDTYTEYRTDVVVGNTGIQPLVAFQPINGEEAEGPNDIAIAPAGFPDALNNGVFVGMHGRFSLGGLSNEENPLVFVNLDDNSYFHFISNDEANVGHLDGLLSTADSLFVADLSPSGPLGGGAANSGVIYQIQSIIIDGDFNDDGFWDCADLNALSGEIAAGTDNTDFDMDGDGDVDADDLGEWLVVGGANNPDETGGNPFLVADANLDGNVDGQDFLAWNDHKFTMEDAYCNGDFNADGVVDGADFIEWNNNKFTSSDAVAVPEATPAYGLLLLATFAGWRRWRT